jgi:hypothetical protein
MRDFSLRAFAAGLFQKRSNIFAPVLPVRFAFHVTGKYVKRGEYRGGAASEVIRGFQGGNMQAGRQRQGAPLKGRTPDFPST